MQLAEKAIHFKNKNTDTSVFREEQSSPKDSQSTNDLLKAIYSKLSSLRGSIKKDEEQSMQTKQYICPSLLNTTKNLRSLATEPKVNLSLSSKANQLLNSNIYRVFDKSASKISSQMMRSYSNISISKDKDGTKLAKQNKFRLKTLFKRNYQKIQGLTREQRYFQDKPTVVSPQIIQSLGFYQAANIFKTTNISQSLQKLSVVAKKPEFNLMKTTNKHQLFLTNVQSACKNFCVEDFIEEQLNKQKKREKIIESCNSVRNPKQCKSKQMQVLSLQQKQIQQSQLYIIFKNYQPVKNQDFSIFKVKQLTNWGQIQANITTICKCLKIHNISYLKVKSEKLVIWRGRRLTFEDIKNLLNLKFRQQTAQKILRICVSFLQRLKVRKIKKQIARKQNLARWVLHRLKTLVLLCHTRQEKIERAHRLHQEWCAEMKWEVQIYMPSFSVDYFKRSTTQYMQAFQNIYHSIWKVSGKQLILILPTLNQNILDLVQSRLKTRRNITIICPEIHEAFPLHLSLASQVLFSYETLNKIRNAIGGKSAVLITGGYESQTNELLLSQYLNVPLLCSLNINNDCQNQKSFFEKANVLTPVHCIIPSASTFLNIVSKFASLIAQHASQKKWVIKLNAQFKGRGIATISFNPCKYLKGLNQSQNISIIQEYLKTNLKLKLKLNFENSLFTVEEYVSELQRKGGVIQQYMAGCTSYELCFNKLKTCQLLYSYKMYGLEYSNKVWLSYEIDDQVLTASSKIQEQLQKECYYGFISVSICKKANREVYGIDVKLRKTPSSSIVSLIQMIQDRRNTHQSSAISLNQLPTKRVSVLNCKQNNYCTNDNALQIPLKNYNYLIIPDMVLTDIDQVVKGQLIQNLMKQCWQNHHLKIYQQCSIYLSMGVDLSLILMGKDLKRLKKRAIQLIRQLNDRTNSYRQYRGKQIIRDVFRYSDIIRAIGQIKIQQ